MAKIPLVLTAGKTTANHPAYTFAQELLRQHRRFVKTDTFDLLIWKQNFCIFSSGNLNKPCELSYIIYFTLRSHHFVFVQTFAGSLISTLCLKVGQYRA